MAVVKELIRTEENGTISFGDYEKNQKSKVSDYPHQGDMYKVKTFKEITKLERNGMFVYGSVPGTAVFDLAQDGSQMSFRVEGPEDAQITVELEAEAQYEVYLDGASTGKMETNLGGKLSFSVELGNGSAVDVKIVKCKKKEPAHRMLTRMREKYKGRCMRGELLLQLIQSIYSL